MRTDEATIKKYAKEIMSSIEEREIKKAKKNKNILVTHACKNPNTTNK